MIYDSLPNLFSNNTCKIIDSMAFFAEKELQDWDIKRYTNKEIGNTYRLINFWESNGLLNDERDESGKGWRKFNIYDIFLLKILTKLREFGMPLKMLKKVKESLLDKLISIYKWKYPEHYTIKDVIVDRKREIHEGKKVKAFDLSIFQAALLLFRYINCFTNHKNKKVYLLVKDSGEVALVGEWDLTKETFALPDNAIWLCLNTLFSQNLANMSLLPESDTLGTIESLLESDDAESIKFDKKKNIIETESRGTPSGNLHDIIGKLGYGELNLVVKDGKVCSYQKTQKRKYK